jgi:thiol-disulfide isomerase/thioredoxin
VVREFDGKARFAVENYGDSELARRLGITRYPAILVDDVLVATPKDFGFYGPGEGKGEGRYAPLKSAATHERFRADLARMIALVLAGREDVARAEAPAASTTEVSELPAFSLTDVDGKAVSGADLAGRVVVIEFWATWCPPCRGTLAFLADLARRHGDRLVVVALAIESEEGKVKDVARSVDPSGRAIVWAMATPEVGRAFGDVSAIPALYVFGRDGRSAGSFFGAPPDAKRSIEGAIAPLLD